jgi:hypothetical protein
MVERTCLRPAAVPTDVGALALPETALPETAAPERMER